MADIKPSKIVLNFIPGVQTSPDSGIGVPAIRDGAYLQNLSLQNRAFSSTVNIDKLFVAGQNIDAGETCGMWGFIVKETLAILADQATFIDEATAAADVNWDDRALGMSDADAPDRDQRILTSYDSLPEIPSETGLSIITIEVKVHLFEQIASDNCNPQVHPNTASFDETTVTWNTGAPGFTAEIGRLPAGSNANAYVDTGWVEINSTQYNNIRDNGVTFADQVGAGYTGAKYSDDDGNDTANKPKIDVRFTYEIQDDKIYLASGLLKKYADAFRGFAQNSIIKGDTIKVRVNGVDSNQSGLTKHSDYELSDTPGAIQTGTSATSDKVVCTALNKTEVQINYRLDDAT